MDKQAPESLIPWSDMEPTKYFYFLLRESCLFLVNKSSLESGLMTTLKNSTKSMFLCFKFITKESRTYLFRLTKDQNKVIKSDSTRLSVSTSKGFLSTTSIHMTPSRRKWRKEEETGQSPLPKWMHLPVELTPLYQFSLSKDKWSKAKKDKNCQLFT